MQGEPLFTVDVAWTQRQAWELLQEYKEDDTNSKYSISDTEGQDGITKTPFNKDRFNKYKGLK